MYNYFLLNNYKYIMCTNYDSHKCPEYYTDSNEMIKKLTKYFIEGFVVALVLRWVPSRNLSVKEIAIISLVASGTLILLDTYSPKISNSYRNGIGLALGAQTVLSKNILP